MQRAERPKGLPPRAGSEYEDDLRAYGANRYAPTDLRAFAALLELIISHLAALGGVDAARALRVHQGRARAHRGEALRHVWRKFRMTRASAAAAAAAVGQAAPQLSDRIAPR